MKNLRDIFPKASEAFFAANANALSALAEVLPKSEPPKDSTTTPAQRMNATEHGFSIGLEASRRAGLIEDWKFEAVKLRIGPRCFYTPDFLVERFGQKPLFLETKGPFVREDSRVKFIAAKELHKWADFEMHQLTQGDWRRIL